MDTIQTEEMKWDLHNWICQIIFFIITNMFFWHAVIEETQGPTAQWYYYGSIAIFICSSIGAALPAAMPKNIIAMSTIMINVLLMPMVLFTAGYDLGIAAALSLLYVIIIGAISPYVVAIGTGIAALGLAIYLHLDNNVFQTAPEFKQQPVSAVQDGSNTFASGEPAFYRVKKDETNLIELSILHYKSEDHAYDIYEANKEKLGETPNNITILKDTELVIPNITKPNYKSPIVISILYIIAVALGIGWKMYIIKMFELCTNALANSSSESENEILNLKDELEHTQNNCRLLKEEMAIQIIEMNQITGLNKES